MRLIHKASHTLFIAALLLFSPLSLYAQDNDTLTLTADGLSNQGIKLDGLRWRYHTGDDTAWANPQFDDGSWEIINGTRLTLDDLPQTGWSGIGWFRLRVRVDARLAGQPLALVMRHWGASEIYVDGKLIHRFGTIGAREEAEREFNPNGTPASIVFDGSGDHIIAVRHSVQAMRDVTSGWGRWLATIVSDERYGVGFAASIAELNNSIAAREGFLEIQAGNRIGRVILCLSFALLHLFLFWFYPRQRDNLFFSLFAVGLALPTLMSHLQTVGHYGAEKTVFLNMIETVGLALRYAALLAFLYTTFSFRIPKYYWLFLIALVADPVLLLLFPESEAFSWFYQLLALFISAESIRIVIQAVRKHLDGAWIVCIGVLLFNLDRVRNLISPSTWLNLTLLQVYTFGIIIAISIYLARNFAITNRSLLEREQEKARMEQELALAADIQKGLFPERLPSIAGYDIAARNRPAQLCGGDYYDVIAIDNENGDGSSRRSYLLCVADVAGKGLDASLLMSNMQATLRALTGRLPSLVELASQINERLYEASPSNKFVTAILLEINPETGEGRYVNAGHNQCVILRHEGGGLDLLESTGLPFGVMPEDMLRTLDKPYEERPFQLRADDLLALYSDGVPEAYNEQEQEWGEAKLQTCLLNFNVRPRLRLQPTPR